MKRATPIKYSKFSLYKKDNINSFRKNNFIKSERSVADNIMQFKLRNNESVRVFDFYEYKIDDKDFSHHLDTLIFHNKDSKLYDPNYSFCDSNVGIIGPYGYFWNRIRLMLLLKNELNKEIFLQEEFVIQHLKSISKEYQDELIDSIIEDSKKTNVSLYFTYGDEYYPVGVMIEVEKDVKWVFDSSEGKHEWIFKKEDYCNTLNILLDYFEREWLKKTYG